MPDDVLKQLVERVLNDKGFRDEALKDIESTLSKHGYAEKLTQEELAAVKEFHAKNNALDPEELNNRLAEAWETSRVFLLYRVTRTIHTTENPGSLPVLYYT